MIHAIQTVYPWPNGPRYRSRLEARWAVFFETIGIEYEYEKQGFDLDGVPYLPDFWLPEPFVWMEVKGADPSRAEQEKCRRLAMAGCPVMLFTGEIQPDKKMQHGVIFVRGVDEHGNREVYCLQPASFALCPLCLKIGVAIIMHRQTPPWEFYCFRCGDQASATIPTVWDGILAGYAAARQARFEHGETPKPRKRH